ncbi:hypothetical protein [Serratia microhaemolytica]|uniref:hypothetical protein n=1 Tax=Serratia microhaemolytica TaxID=2675110 RepID=UPI000FDCFC8D|nr:hypothetical protein [Serratia microhaemolytica]
MMNLTHKNIKELLEGLSSYLTNGYVNELSTEAPEKDAFDYLNMLYSIDQNEGIVFCKLILESRVLYNDFLRSTCLLYLLLSERDWEYAFLFLLNNILSIQLLKEGLVYFYCAKNETEPHPVPDGLFKKLMDRYEELKDDPDADFYHLHEAYNDFVKAYSLDT